MPDDAAAPGLGKQEGGAVGAGLVDSAPLGWFKEELKKGSGGWLVGQCRSADGEAGPASRGGDDADAREADAVVARGECGRRE